MTIENGSLATWSIRRHRFRRGLEVPFENQPESIWRIFRNICKYLVLNIEEWCPARVSDQKTVYWKFEPQRLDWWSAIFAIIGALLFTFAYIAGIITESPSLFLTRVIFLAASCCFLVSDALMYPECSGITSISFWNVSLGVFASLIFVIASSFYLLASSVSYMMLLVGGIIYLIAAVFLYIETSMRTKDPENSAV